MCINLSSIVDMDNNGIEYISKKYDIIITEKANRKYLTLHQFFFDVSFTIFNPLIIFVMYLFARFFSQEYHRDLFVYLTSIYFAFISIVSLIMYAIGLERTESSSKRGEKINDNNYKFQNNLNNVEEGNIKDNEINENDFDKYYEKNNNNNNKSDQYVNNYTNAYPSVYVMQNQVHSFNDNYDPYSNKEIITLKDQYKTHFKNIKINLKHISNDYKLLFYLSSLSFLNSVEDITMLMLIPFTSIFACEFFYVESLFIKVLIAIILISLGNVSFWVFASYIFFPFPPNSIFEHLHFLNFLHNMFFPLFLFLDQFEVNVSLKRARQHPCHVNIYAMSISIPCQYLYHVNIYTMSISIPCQHLYHVNIYAMSTSIPCQYLCHVNIYTMSISIPCQYLYHVNIFVYVFFLLFFFFFFFFSAYRSASKST
ncbi:hypothetical protein [Plasmodium yoelii yoelii]|uniref:Uncharacterized protein n=1 Tax=Plasmodium yoelii yoelii TaxID=73239 RepID=Q7REN6_PLAYO|nr:hypothetical protein [Plasmodium yoelii yoelii]